LILVSSFINIGGNKIQSKGAGDIFEAVKHSSSLSTLKLGKIFIIN